MQTATGQPGRDARSGDVPAVRTWVPRLGIAAWSFVGFVVAAIIVVVALAAVSEIVLPLTFVRTRVAPRVGLPGLTDRLPCLCNLLTGLTQVIGPLAHVDAGRQSRRYVSS